jgi:peptidyl-prolyl cis-trans isomerase A (cyclophilin A)
MATLRRNPLAGAGLALAIGLTACGGKASSDPPIPTACSAAGTAAGAATTLTNAVCILTSQGEIVVELDGVLAPLTVANFMRYVDAGFYDGTIIDDVRHLYFIQAGAYTASALKPLPSGSAPIPLESNNGLHNTRGTLAMNRDPLVPTSATSQFFINLDDNSVNLDYQSSTPGQEGYTVFGRVISGMDIVDRIGALPTPFPNSQRPYPMVTVIWAKRLK